MSKPVGQCIDRRVIAYREHFDPAVIEVAGMPAQPQRHRLLAGAGAEEHALHVAADEEAGDAHDSTSTPVGAGPPASAIASSIPRAVTGPSTLCATRPSGAIR